MLYIISIQKGVYTVSYIRENKKVVETENAKILRELGISQKTEGK